MADAIKTTIYVFQLRGIWIVGRGEDLDRVNRIEGLGVTGRGRAGKAAAIAAANTEAAKTGECVEICK